MEIARGKFERTNSLDLLGTQQSKGTDEKSKFTLTKKMSADADSVKTDKSDEIESVNENIPEIKDIYDYIYGNVQSKLEFYENKHNVSTADRKVRSKSCSETSDSLNEVISENGDVAKPLELETSVSSSKTDLSVSDNGFGELALPPHVSPDSPSEEQKDANSDAISETSSSLSDDRKIVKELHSDSDASTEREIPCTKCQRFNFINDRTDVLTEINANMKLELEKVQRQLKKEVAKNNELNYEIANIESALEKYYKEAGSQKSTLASLYSTMKSYTTSQRGDFQESYTFKRVKIIADYMETLKSKLEHQDRIIKGNFVENPYYTDVIIKHEAALRQLDEISKENQELKSEMKKTAAEELEIIKELNRQKFQIENKCKEIESRYKAEVATKDASIRNFESERKKQLDECHGLLLQKDDEMVKMQEVSDARIKNYKQELVLVYRKWKQQKLINNSNNLTGK